MLCPNCSVEFAEHNDKAYRCYSCGWLTKVDGEWHPCPEPAKVTEPDLPKLPKAPAEPVVPENDNVRSYMGGLVTVTIKDDQNEEIA